MKKVFLLMPFVVGMGVMVFAVVLAFAEAETPTCNKYVASGWMTESAACSIVISFCFDYNTQNCQNKIGRVTDLASPTVSRYFAPALTQNPQNHVIVAGTVLCAYEYYCKLSGLFGHCISGDRVIDPSTGQQKEKRGAYCTNSSYCVPAE